MGSTAADREGMSPRECWDRLSADPEDWDARSALAALYEAAGHAGAAACVRWMVRHRKRPYHELRSPPCWFNAETISAGLGDPSSDVPGAVYRRLARGREVANHRSYRAPRDAEEDFHAAWEAARQAGWLPDADPLRRLWASPAPPERVESVMPGADLTGFTSAPPAPRGGEPTPRAKPAFRTWLGYLVLASVCGLLGLVLCVACLLLRG